MKIRKFRFGAGKLLGMVILLCALLFALLVDTHVPAGASPGPGATQSDSGWELVPTSNIGSMYSLDMVDSTLGWAGAARGGLYVYDGVEWVVGAVMDFDDIISGIHFLSATSGWAVTSRGRLLRFDGASWAVHSKPVDEWLDDVYMNNETDGWAVGEGGKILHYNGTSWNQVSSPSSDWLEAICMVQANDGWIVGGSGTILHWTGAGWNRLSSTWGHPWLHDVDMVSATDGWVVGSGGIILHYDGNTWSEVDSPTSMDLWAVGMSSSNLGWAVGKGGTILEYDGDSWNEVLPTLTYRTLNALDVVSATDAWAVGDMGTILHYTGRPPDLSNSFKTASVPQIAPGEQLTYTIGLENTGDLLAPEVVVTDAIPVNTTYVPGSAKTTQGTIQSTAPLVVHVGDIAPSSMVTISFSVTVGDPGQACWFLPNEAEIASGDTLLNRYALTTVGDCFRTFVPIVFR